MAARISVAGFRHIHIFDLLGRIRTMPGLSLAAMCEENEAASLMPENILEPTHADFDDMLAAVDCEIVALGDCYGRRGSKIFHPLHRVRAGIWRIFLQMSPGIHARMA